MLAKIPFGTAGPVDAEEFNDAAGEAIVLPMSIAWTGGKLPKCSGADIAPERYYDETVDILDLAELATYWLHIDCK